MDDKEEETKTNGAGGQRVTVVYSDRDMLRVEGAVQRASEDKGYPVPRADVLRKLVQDHWPVPATPAPVSE